MDAGTVAGRITTWRAAAQPGSRRSIAHRRTALGIGLAAALLLAGAVVAVYLTAGATRSTAPTAPDAGPPVAVMTDVADVRWGGTPVDAGQSIAEGPISIDAGRLEFETLGGVNVVLHGSTRYVVTGPNAGRLRSGTMRARIAGGADGFTVTLPHDLRVVDLGTEFALAVDKAGGCELAVLDGRVEVTRHGRSIATLATGQIVRIEPGQPPLTLAQPDGTRGAILDSGHPIHASFDEGAGVHPALELTAPDRFAVDGGTLRYVGPVDTRGYLRTRRGGLLERDLRLEATFTTRPREEDGRLQRLPIGNRIYIGIGDAVPSTNWNEAAHSFGFALVLADGDVVVQSTNDGVIRRRSVVPTAAPLYGRVRVRLDKRGRELWLALDRDPVPGAFNADHTIGPFTIPKDAPFDAADAHAFLGTGNFGLATEIDDVTVTIDPTGDAPDASSGD